MCPFIHMNILMERNRSCMSDLCARLSNLLSVKLLCIHGNRVLLGVLFDACCSRNTWGEDSLLGFIGPLYQGRDRQTHKAMQHRKQEYRHKDIEDIEEDMSDI